MANKILWSKDGVYSVASVYLNTPSLPYREGSPIHHGAFMIQVEGDPVDALAGSYWTDRKTRGTARFTEKSREFFYNFEQAHGGIFEEPRMMKGFWAYYVRRKR
jgi:hypothetical protein